MTQRAALVKLAQVRLAITHVLRTRTMQKQAEGSLDFTDPGANKHYSNGEILPPRISKAPWEDKNRYVMSPQQRYTYDPTPVPDSLGGILDEAVHLPYPSNMSAGEQIERKYGVPTAMALRVLRDVYPATRLGQATGLADAIARVNPLDGRENWTADVAQRLYDKLIYDPYSKRQMAKRKAREAVEQPLKGQQSLAPLEFFTPNPPGQETNPGWNPLYDAGVRFPEELRFK